MIEHLDRALFSAEDVPTPSPLDQPISLTVIDAGWSLNHILAGPGWLGEQVREAQSLVLVSRATVPGLRRLETALDLLTLAGCSAIPGAMVALVGAPRGRLPRTIEHSIGPHTQRLLATGRAVVVRHHPRLARAGVDTAPLPAPLLSAAADLLTGLVEYAGTTSPEQP